MKNIHVLPTDKPSRLFIYYGKLGFAKGFQYGSDAILNQHIYITSDKKIKEGDWVKRNDGDRVEKAIHNNLRYKWRKIILTTDKDLIKDGIQAIDDEFLSWFIKNPSCENVTVLQKGANTIIFPTPKNDIISDLIELERGVTITHANKQETLEEAAENFLNNSRLINLKTLFIEGAKWQSERMYSEEEVLDLLFNYGYDLLDNERPVTGNTTEEWFEQFKKK